MDYPGATAGPPAIAGPFPPRPSPLPPHLLEIILQAPYLYLATVQSGSVVSHHGGFTHLSAHPPAPHLSLMVYTPVAQTATDLLVVVSSRRDTVKFNSLQTLSAVSLLIHDKGYSVGMTLTGTARTCLQGSEEERSLRALHASRNPGFSQFIRGEEYAIVAITVTHVRVSDLKDAVQNYTVSSPPLLPAPGEAGSSSSTSSSTSSSASSSTSSSASSGGSSGGGNAGKAALQQPRPNSAAAASTPGALRLAVGSTNVTKLNAVKEGFAACSFGSASSAGSAGSASNPSAGTSAASTDSSSSSSSSSAPDGGSSSVSGEGSLAHSSPTPLQVVGSPVESGVSVQPMGDAETRLGARNRAEGALLAWQAANAGASPDFAIGLEGGCGEEFGELVCFAWVCIIGAAAGAEAGAGTGGAAAAQKQPCCAPSKLSYARTASFALPQQVAALVRGGMELGLADDKVFGRQDSKSKDGAVGLLTRGAITRTAYYAHAVTLALAPFVSARLYAEEQGGGAAEAQLPTAAAVAEAKV